MQYCNIGMEFKCRIHAVRSSMCNEWVVQAVQCIATAAAFAYITEPLPAFW